MCEVTNGLPDTAAKEIWEIAIGEDFTENLEIAEVLAPAEISHDSDPERLVKVASLRKTKIARSACELR